MMKHWTLLLLILSLAIISCKKDDDSGDDCEKKWNTENTQSGSSISISSGSMELKVTNAVPNVSAQAFQGFISGDFSATATFDGFTAGTGNGGYAQMIISSKGFQDSVAIVGIGNLGISALVKSQLDLKIVAGNSGTFSISRIGNMVTAATTMNGQTATSTAVFPTDDVNIGFQIGSNNETLTGTTGIKITDFTISNGEDVKSDSFDCNSIR